MLTAGILLWAAVYLVGLVIFVRRSGRGRGFYAAALRPLGRGEAGLRTLRALMLLWLFAGPFVLVWFLQQRR